MFTLTWLAGFLATLTALAICRAEARAARAGETPGGGVGFDKPMRRAMAFGLALVTLGLLTFYAAMGNGLVAPGAALALLAVLLRLPHRVPLAHWGGAALPLGLFGFVCVIAAFQQLYGDNFFGFDDPFS